MKNTHLEDAERSQIHILLGKGYSHRDIGDALGRPQSSISREIKRNITKGKYDPRAAKLKARNRRKCSKYQGMKVEKRPKSKVYIIAALKAQWTPEEIAGRLKKVDTHIPYVSAKGIYKWLYSVWGQQYCSLLPKQRSKPRKRQKKKPKREMIPNRIGIEYRPVKANNRTEFGHFEEDTIVSGRKTKSKAALAVFCERKARYSKLRKMKNMKPTTHVKAQRNMAHGLKMKTITYDNGIENKNHEDVAKELKVTTFFCNPYSSWEKGMVENTNGRIRRFIPKGADIATYSHQQIQIIEDWLNHTPRKCLDFRTPYEIMKKNLRFISSPTDAFEG
jgi:IS30 family transposase